MCEKSGYSLLEEGTDGCKAVEEREQSQIRARSTRRPIRNENDAKSKKEFMENFNFISVGEVSRVERNIVATKQREGSILRFILRIILKKIMLVKK